MICTTIDIEDPACDPFLVASAMQDFRPYALDSNIMQLMGLFKGTKLYLFNYKSKAEWLKTNFQS